MLNEIEKKYVFITDNLSSKRLGLTGKNPSVACLIVDFSNDKNGRVISYGLTSFSGKPHAEINALSLKNNVKNAPKYYCFISLEPCYKEDKKNCSFALSKLNFKKIIISSLDPNPNIFKKG